MKNLAAVLLFSFALSVFVGCSSSGTARVSVEQFSQKAKKHNASKASLLMAGDDIELSVEVDGRMEVLAHRASINHFGMATLPLVGDVKIAGLTLGDARNVISKTYGTYFVNPPVIMITRVQDETEGEWGYVTVTGLVREPGRVKITSADGIKLTAVIQAAGGFAASAKQTGIRISRTEETGTKIRVDVDYREIGEEGNIDADVLLLDGDIVYVPERVF